MVERGGGHADALHALVQGLTGKESITALTPAEAQAVLCLLYTSKEQTTMEKRYNKELQERTRAYVEAGTSQAELSRRLGMNNSCLLYTSLLVIIYR